jgi:hypothetical protein
MVCINQCFPRDKASVAAYPQGCLWFSVSELVKWACSLVTVSQSRLQRVGFRLVSNPGHWLPARPSLSPCKDVSFRPAQQKTPFCPQTRPARPRRSGLRIYRTISPFPKTARFAGQGHPVLPKTLVLDLIIITSAQHPLEVNATPQPTTPATSSSSGLDVSTRTHTVDFLPASRRCVWESSTLVGG